MLKRLLLLGFLFTTGFVCQGQKLVWGSFDKFSGANTHCDVIGESENGLLILRFKDKDLKKNVYIDLYDHGLRLQKSLGISERKKVIEKVLFLKERLHVIYQYPDYSAKKLYYKAFDFANSENKPELKEWLTINTSVNKIYNFDIAYNFSRTLGAVHYLTAGSDKSNFNLQFFDANLKLKQKTELEINTSAKNIKILSKLIDQYGNFYMIYQAQTGGFFAKDNDLVYLAMYNTKKDEWKTESLNTEEFYISTSKMVEDIKGDRVLCAYFYSLAYKNGNYGLANCSYSCKDQSRQYQKKQKLEEDFTRKINGKKIGKEKELNSFFIQDIIPTSDSGSIVVAERFFLTDQNETFYQNGIPVTSSRNVYNFEEVLLFSVNKFGGSRWSKVLLKRQSSINDGGYFSSIIIIPSPEKLNILYNEKLTFNGDVIQVSIDQDGQSSQKNLFRNDMSSYMVIPSESRIVGYNRAAIPMYFSNGERGLLKIVY